MTCRLDACNQGRKPCPNPAACAGLVQAEGGARIHRGTVTRRDEPPVTTDDFFSWAEDMWRAGLTVAKWLAAAGLLIFVLGLSAGYFHR